MTTETAEVGAELERAGKLELPGSLRMLHASGRLTSTALEIDDPSISYEAFEQVAADIHEFRSAVNRLRDMSKFWAGDLMVTGESLFGEQAFQAFEALGAPPGALQDWLRVARSVLPGARRAELSWTHHRAVASKDEARQAQLLEHAVAEGLNVDDFRSYLRDLEREIAAGDRDLSGGGEDSRTNARIVVEHLIETARRCYHQAQRTATGDAIVPAELWTQFGAALGEDE